MNTKKQTSKPKTSAQQKTGGDCPSAHCSAVLSPPIRLHDAQFFKSGDGMDYHSHPHLLTPEEVEERRIRKGIGLEFKDANGKWCRCGAEFRAGDTPELIAHLLRSLAEVLDNIGGTGWAIGNDTLSDKALRSRDLILPNDPI